LKIILNVFHIIFLSSFGFGLSILFVFCLSPIGVSAMSPFVEVVRLEFLVVVVSVARARVRAVTVVGGWCVG
jgi:hypothetical protein